MVTKNPDGTVTVTLAKPLKLNETTTIPELVFQPMNGKIARQVQTQTERVFAMLLDVAGRCTGHPAVIMDMLEGPDLAEVLEVAKDFLPSGQLTGVALTPS